MEKGKDKPFVFFAHFHTYLAILPEVFFLKLTFAVLSTCTCGISLEQLINKLIYLVNVTHGHVNCKGAFLSPCFNEGY